MINLPNLVTYSDRFMMTSFMSVIIFFQFYQVLLITNWHMFCIVERYGALPQIPVHRIFIQCKESIELGDCISINADIM